MCIGIYASDLQDLFQSELLKLLGPGESSQEQVLSYTALLLTPTRLTTVQKEEQMLYEIQDEFERTNPHGTLEQYEKFCIEARERFEAVAHSYGWFHMEYLGEAKTASEYQSQIWDRIIELRQSDVDWAAQVSPGMRLKSIREEQHMFFSAHPSSELFRQLVFALQEFQIVLDFTKADLVEGIYNARPLYQEIGKRVGVGDWISVRYLLPQEVHALLASGDKVDFDYIKERTEHFAILLENDTISTYFGKEAVRVVNELFEPEGAQESVRECKGMTAYPGVVKGTACIITNASERDKFKPGLILVTRETTTELTSVIKQSIAIVADQGSMLSHTAIVSREFKIPCIVRTNVGTQIIKDGDELEVDATNGTVRILNR
jgi:phosphoenolpyruvate synthase/pyruvate phosphate dikinase